MTNTEPEGTPIGDTHLTATFNCEHCGMETNQRFTVPCTECDQDMKVCPECVNKNPFHDECPITDTDNESDEEKLTMEDEDQDEPPVQVEEVHTQLADGTQNAATTNEAATAAANTDNIPVDAEAAGEQKISAYRKRLNEKGLDAFPLEAPKELVDMLRVAAEQAGGLALAALTRKLIAEHVNSLNLTHEDPTTHQTVPWKFDTSRLDESRSRVSTRGLTEEQKEARKEKIKENAKAERELVKQLLAAHRAKLKGGDPSAAALEATLSANGSN